MLHKILFYSILSFAFLERVFEFQRVASGGCQSKDCDSDEFVIVETFSGPVRGRHTKTLYEAQPYWSFKGIPYAQPPIDELRFKPPVPVRRWHDVRDCFNYGSPCLQTNSSTMNVIGNEDCLFLNVFTPAIEPKRLQSVMLYIHGGAWYRGRGDIVPPDFLIHQDIVVVTINYRLGAIGFASLGTPEYSGNQGLKDQQLAMKWVHDNIERFGGNSDSVTIFGDSAATMSSIYHMFAPGSKGLYRRAIEMSSTYDIWSIAAKPNNYVDMLRFAQSQNSSVLTTTELVDHLKRADATDYVREFPFMFQNCIIMPTLEVADALQPLALVSPSDLVLENESFRTDVDVMTGFTANEALAFARSAPEKNFVENLRIQLPSIHFNSYTYHTVEYRLAARKIANHYFPNASEYTKENLERLRSDVYQRYFVDKRIKQLAEKSTGRTYYYRFAMESSLNYFKLLIGAERGVAHGDDLCYISPCNFTLRSQKMYRDITIDSQEYQMIRTMSGLYANFAKYGNPAPGLPDFEPVQANRYTFLNISNDGLSVGDDPFGEPRRFWDQLMSEHPSLVNLWRR